MLGHRYQQYGNRRDQPPAEAKDLKICWANVGKSHVPHLTLLQLAFMNDVDVICVQEPSITPNTHTQRHPAYDHYAPVDSWDWETIDGYEAARPKVLTYIRKGAGLTVRQRRPLARRDLLWIDVNGRAILNIYRTPDSSMGEEVIDYVTQLACPPNCVIGGDFNVHHELFEPGVSTANRGTELARWAGTSGMDFIGTPGDPTHRAGHVLDLTFSNIPFAMSTIVEDMQCGSDHETQVTIVPGRGELTLERLTYGVPDSVLPKLAGLVRNSVQQLPDPWEIQSTAEIDTFATVLAELIDSAVKIVGRTNQSKGKSAPWWTPECQEAFDEHLTTRTRQWDGGITPQTREFYSVVRKAKREYWRGIIDGVKSDKDLYRVIAWHKHSSALKAPPLVVNGRVIEDTREKADILRAEVLGRFTAEDDLETDPLQDWNGTGDLPWEVTVSLEEVERNTIGVTSTSPGTDRVTVRLLKACWEWIKKPLHGLYNRCLALSYFPQGWKFAEVAMQPKVGKKDKSSVRSWRPIALLSCISKGLERIISRRIAWTSLIQGVLSPQHCGALPKRSAMDLVACFTHDVEEALARGEQVTMVTMDVQGAFDALLPRRLLQRMSEQGWPLPLLRLINSFLSDRKVRVRLEDTTTDFHSVGCGTPQGSPLSPVLYMLYLAELLLQDPALRFGYADDICLYRATRSLDSNVQLLATDIREIIAWGNANKVYFAPEKLEMIHLTKARHDEAPPCVVNEEIIIMPIHAPAAGTQPALRWLGVWFDRKLTFRRHICERATKARSVAQHIRSLGKTVHGPPASSLRKAVITCVGPSITYGHEAWYPGRRKPAANNAEVSTRLGWHVERVQGALAVAARGVLPVWKTTPVPVLFRDAGLPSAEALLEESKLRFALRLKTVDEQHPLVRRTLLPIIARGRGAGTGRRPQTKIQLLGTIFSDVPRPELRPPHFSAGCREDPTGGIDKRTASRAFKEWFASIPPSDVAIFSDGSEQYKDGFKYVGYGYSIYRDQKEIASGYGGINSTSHVFDAEVTAAWRGLQHALSLPGVRGSRIWQCIDSTSVIQCLRGNASTTSQWAFHKCQDAMQSHDIRVRWSPGHTGIEGNEAADRLADQGAFADWAEGLESEPTISGMRSVYRKFRDQARDEWWNKRSQKLSERYRRWAPTYTIRNLPELQLPRGVLHRYLALRTGHGDFSWYHRKFKHADAELKCSCKRHKAPGHIVFCRRTQRHFERWPHRPATPPTSTAEGMQYLAQLLTRPTDFEKLLEVTEFYSKICPR
jgi:ribonuclease HI